MFNHIYNAQPFFNIYNIYNILEDLGTPCGVTSADGSTEHTRKKK